MVVIEQFDQKDGKSVKALARLHVRAFPDFFLTRLGVSFLRALYAGYIYDEKSGIIVAKSDGITVGFIAYSNDYPNFFRNLIKKHLLKFAFCSAKAAILHPSYVKRIFGAFKKSDQVKKPEKYVELASICVDPAFGKRGIGTMLINKLKETVDFKEFAYINLETDANDNDPVNAFYVKNGFKLNRTYVTGEGRPMNEYIYKPEENV